MAKSAKTAPQAPKSPSKTPELVPQPHGGALLSGGQKGNKGGPGRPTGALRARMFGALDEQLAVASDIASGQPVEMQEINLPDVLAHVECPSCGGGLQPKSVDDMLAKITVRGSASAGERLRALDFLARYGLGAIKAVSEDDVRSRVERTLDVIAELVTKEQYARIVPELQKIWTEKGE